MRHLVVLDIDDTLLHTHEVAHRKSVLTARALGLTPPTEEAFRQSFGSLSFEECLHEWHGDVSPDEYLRIYETFLPTVPYCPVDGALETMTRLREIGFGTAVLTNGPGVKTWRKLAALGIRTDDLLFVRHSGNVRTRKPSPAAFADLVAEHGVDPSCTTYVSDCPDDGTGALAAGFGFLGVLTGVWDAAAFRVAGVPDSAVLPTVRDVLPVLDTMVPVTV
ncbi:HAD family hydrolase [Streptomyces sp. NPDC046994]|uniref:HAD family hydrolase n=1 Tax=Streptomyces sp. NPDC046994 TaxID=3155735 RepID=UPI003451DFE5